MSRSHKHTPITGITVAKSEKKDKKTWHRRFRSKAKLKPDILENEVSSTWNMAKDGKAYHDKETIQKHPELLRK